MDIEAKNKAVTEFLQVIVHIHEGFQELAHRLRSGAEVKTVKVYSFIPEDRTQHHWDEEQRQPAIGSEFGVSAELYEGALVDWWLTVRCQESGWYITASLLRSDKDEEGCHKVAEFDDQHSLTFEAAMKQLLDAAAWLAAKGTVIGSIGIDTTPNQMQS